jgi:hypothetical protein
MSDPCGVPAAIAAIADMGRERAPVADPRRGAGQCQRGSLACHVAHLEGYLASTRARAEAAASPMARDLDLRCIADIEVRLAEARAALAEFAQEGQP